MKKIYLLLVLACSCNCLYAQNCNMIVDFVSDSTTGNPHIINFTNLSTPLDATDSIVWDFGDGGYFSNDVNPSHAYNGGGAYRVCLQVYKNTATTSCVSQYCREIFVAPNCNFTPDFYSLRDSTSSSYTFINSFFNYNTDSSFWDFGDGSPVQYAPNGYLSHVYASNGVYNVCLLVKRRYPGTNTVLCIKQYCKPVTINLLNCNTTANFTFAADAVNEQQVQFTNLTPFVPGQDSIEWSFGDSYRASEVNPVHIFSNGGTYDVCLRIIDNDPANGATCFANICQQVTVPYVCPPSINFSWAPDTLPGSSIIRFYNSTYSFNIYDSCFWDFGDGSPVQYAPFSASHQYAANGTYTVCMTGKKMEPGTINVICTRNICQTITVNNMVPCNLHSSFTSNVFLPGNNNLQHYFRSTVVDIPGMVYTWDFGDGASGSGSDVLHTYAQTGNYTVCLTVSANATCSSTSCNTVNVFLNNAPPCDTNTVSFTYNRDYYLPNKLYFFPAFYLPAYNQQWEFTKAGTTDTLRPSIFYGMPYIFPETGVYSACLTVTYYNGCKKTYCEDIAINSVAAPSYCYLLAFPNPTSNTASVNVELEQPSQITTTIFSLQGLAVGQVVQQGTTGNNIVSLNIASLPTGFYSVQINYGNKVCYSRFQKI